MAPFVKFAADRFGDKPAMFGVRKPTAAAAADSVQAEEPDDSEEPEAKPKNQSKAKSKKAVTT